MRDFQTDMTLFLSDSTTLQEICIHVLLFFPTFCLAAIRLGDNSCSELTIQ